MVTQELISYVRGEVNKGKSREEIKSALLSGGGWSEADISEVFRAVMPLSGTVEAKPSIATLINPGLTPSPSLAPSTPPAVSPTIAPIIIKPKKSFALSHKTKELIILVLVVAIVGGGGYYYRSQVGNTWSGFQDKISNLSFFNKESLPSAQDTPIIPVVAEDKTPARLMPPKDCGVTVGPDIKSTGNVSNVVLECLGESATTCTPAKATLTSSLMPTIVQISRGDTTDDTQCKFTLSYEETSTLTSITGEKLAGKSITCPVDVVRSISPGSNNTIVFGEPSKSNLSKYGTEVYFYGTSGVFLENEFVKKDIDAIGCTGGFIDLIIDSYNRSKQ